MLVKFYNSYAFLLINSRRILLPITYLLLAAPGNLQNRNTTSQLSLYFASSGIGASCINVKKHFTKWRCRGEVFWDF